MRPLPLPLAHQRLPILSSETFGLAQPERSLTLVGAQTPRSVWIRRFDAQGRPIDPEPILALATLNHLARAPDGTPQAGRLLGGQRYELRLRISEAIHYDLIVDASVIQPLRDALRADAPQAAPVTRRPSGTFDGRGTPEEPDGTASV